MFVIRKVNAHKAIVGFLRHTCRECGKQSHQMLTFAAEVEQGGLCLLLSLSHRDAEHGAGKGSKVQETPALGPVGHSLNPSSAPVSGVASGKSLNTSEVRFLFCKENTIYQDVLFLRFKIIIYMVYTHRHMYGGGGRGMCVCVYFPEEKLFSID